MLQPHLEKQYGPPTPSRDAFADVGLLALFSSLSFTLYILNSKQEPATTNTKPMRPSTPHLLIFLFLLLSAVADASVDEACRAIAAARPNIGYEFCVASLNFDPASYTAGPSELAIVAAKLSVANATRIVSKVGSLMEKESNPSLKDCLSVCSEVYSEAIDHLNEAITDLGSERYKEAMVFLSAALDASDNCEDAFNEEEEESPMAAEDRDYGRLADIALTIAASLG